MAKNQEFEDDEDQEDDDEEFDLEEDDDEPEVQKKTVTRGRPSMQKQKPVPSPKKKQQRFVRHRQEAFDGVYDNETEELMSYEDSTIAILNQLNEVLVRFGE